MKEYFCDIVIVGGGSAGLPAAVAAARQGAKVIIVDEHSVVGGSVVNYNIQLFCGVHERGIYSELVNVMRSIDPDMGKHNCFKKSVYQLAWKRLMDGLPIEMITNCEITAIERDKNSKIISVSSIRHKIFGEIFIDSSGDGDLFALAGCKYRFGRESKQEFNEFFAPENADDVVQQCTLLYSIKRAYNSDNEDVITWSRQADDTYLIWGPSLAIKNPLDKDELSAATVKAYSMLENDIKKWEEKGYVISDIAPKIGVRETRRFEGDYILTLTDILNKNHYKDSICVVGYAIDPWEPEGNPQHVDAKLREICVNTPQYEIPYRCLIKSGYPNLIVAGRCISSSHVANSSLRVMVIAAAIGTAAGLAAAQAVSKKIKVQDIDCIALRKKINGLGIITCLDNLPENLAKKELK